MSGVILPNGKNYFATTEGLPLVGGKVYTYVPGTSTPKDTYTTYAASVANTNPIILDTRGEAAIYWTGDYDVVLKDANDVVIWGPERLNQPETLGVADTLRADLALTTPGSKGAGLIGYSVSSTYVAGTVGAKLAQVISVFDYMTSAEIADVQNGTLAKDVTSAVQAAMSAMSASGHLSLYFPPGNYKITSTLIPPTGLFGAQLIGAGGYDGVRGFFNSGFRTVLTWAGATSATTAVVKFNQASGVVWKGISINCDYKAGYGLQFYSSVQAGSSVKNIVENCTIVYAKADGIIVGEDGNPTANPGDRQFFGNVFRNLTFTGCARSGIHINEWNADQQMMDTVMVYLDDAVSPQNTLNAFWFDHGGQQTMLLNCQSGGMTVVGGVPSSGFAIKNKAVDSSPYSTTGGAFGLTVIGFWQEGQGGLYYGVTSTTSGNPFTFTNCRSYTANTANRSVYIDKGTSLQIPYSFWNCVFFSDVEVASNTFNKESLLFSNCIQASGRFLIDDTGTNVTLDGVYTLSSITGGGFNVPRFCNLMFVTLTSNVGNGIYMIGVTKQNDEVTMVVSQNGVGGYTITWGATGAFSSKPTIPAPNAAASSKSTYTFRSDGSVYYLTAVVNT
jgi:hypothetical protein